MDTQGVCGSLSSSYGNTNSIARSWKVATERGLMVLVGKAGLVCIQASVEAIRGRACKWKLLGWQRRWRERTGRHRYRHLPRGDSQAFESPQKGPMFHQSGKPAPNCSAIESNGKKKLTEAQRFGTTVSVVYLWSVIWIFHPALQDTNKTFKLSFSRNWLSSMTGDI